MTRELRLIVELDGREPQVLGSRQMPDDEPFGVYDLARWVLTVMYRLVTWQAFRNETRDEFDDIVAGLEEAS